MTDPFLDILTLFILQASILTLVIMLGADHICEAFFKTEIHDGHLPLHYLDFRPGGTCAERRTEVMAHAL